MCFSAEVSFAAGVGLLGIGAATLRATPRRAMLPFAAIPLLFGVQQLIEGVLWRRLATAPWGKSDTLVGEAFLFFALFLWPFWMAFAAWSMETHPGRRRLLAPMIACGLAVGLYLMGCAVFRPEYACIAQQHIYYGVQIDPAAKRPINVAYVLSIAAPLVVSSVRGTTLFGVLGIGAATLAAVFFRVGYASVWCFFAAALSVLVLWIVREAGRASGRANGRAIAVAQPLS
jgi:hypothetical protein